MNFHQLGFYTVGTDCPAFHSNNRSIRPFPALLAYKIGYLCRNCKCATSRSENPKIGIPQQVSAAFFVEQIGNAPKKYGEWYLLTETLKKVVKRQRGHKRVRIKNLLNRKCQHKYPLKAPKNTQVPLHHTNHEFNFCRSGTENLRYRKYTVVYIPIWHVGKCPVEKKNNRVVKESRATRDLKVPLRQKQICQTSRWFEASNWQDVLNLLPCASTWSEITQLAGNEKVTNNDQTPNNLLVILNALEKPERVGGRQSSAGQTDSQQPTLQKGRHNSIQGHSAAAN